MDNGSPRVCLVHIPLPASKFSQPQMNLLHWSQLSDGNFSSVPTINIHIDLFYYHWILPCFFYELNNNYMLVCTRRMIGCIHNYSWGATHTMEPGDATDRDASPFLVAISWFFDRLLVCLCLVLFSLPELSDKAEIDEDVMDDMSGEKEIAWRFPEASTTIALNK